MISRPEMLPRSQKRFLNRPLTEFLRWHAWIVYGWKPQSESVPKKPEGFDKISWRYLEAVANPKALIQQRIEKLNNKRLRILRKIARS